MTNTQGLELISTAHQVAGRYRAQHIRSLRLAVLSILSKTRIVQVFGSVRLPRTSSGHHCDVCGDLWTGGLGTAMCGLCEARVHRNCYRGVLLLKEIWDEWLCDRCFVCALREADPKQLVCVLCLRNDGALKFTDTLGWIHPTCVLLSPRVQFSDDLFTHTENKAESGPLQNCCYCGRSSNWTVPCTYAQCEGYFHVKCLQRASKPICMQSKFLRCVKHNAHKLPTPRTSAQHPRKPEAKVTFIDLGDELEILTEPPLPSVPLKRRRITAQTPPESEQPPRKTSLTKRQFYTKFQQETQITEPGTLLELREKLKTFLRANQQGSDFNYYDISHLPRLAGMIGKEGKVEHNTLEAIVLAHSYVVG